MDLNVILKLLVKLQINDNNECPICFKCHWESNHDPSCVLNNAIQQLVKEISMLYIIHAGDSYGDHNFYVINVPKDEDIEKLHKLFVSTYKNDPSDDDRFQETKNFIKWLVEYHNCIVPDYDTYFTEY